MTTTQYFEDLEDVVKWSKKQSWYQEPFYLAGHSLGGLVLMEYALKYREKVKAIAPISTVVSGTRTFQNKSHDIVNRWKKFGWLVEESASRTGLVKRLKWTFMEDLLRYDMLQYSDQLTIPVLLIVGEHDGMIPVESQQLLFDQMKGKKELHIIKGAPHTFEKPEHLREVKSIVNQWIARIA